MISMDVVTKSRTIHLSEPGVPLLYTRDDIDLYGESRQAENDGKVPLPATINCKMSDWFPFRQELQYFVCEVMRLNAPGEPLQEVKDVFGKIFRSDGWTTNRFGTDYLCDYINMKNVLAGDPKWQTIITSHNYVESLGRYKTNRRDWWIIRTFDARKSYDELMADYHKYPHCIYTPTVSGYIMDNGIMRSFVRPFGYLNGKLRIPILTNGWEYNYIEYYEALQVN